MPLPQPRPGPPTGPLRRQSTPRFPTRPLGVDRHCPRPFPETPQSAPPPLPSRSAPGPRFPPKGAGPEKTPPLPFPSHGPARRPDHSGDSQPRASRPGPLGWTGAARGPSRRRPNRLRRPCLPGPNPASVSRPKALDQRRHSLSTRPQGRPSPPRQPDRPVDNKTPAIPQSLGAVGHGPAISDQAARPAATSPSAVSASSSLPLALAPWHRKRSGGRDPALRACR